MALSWIHALYGQVGLIAGLFFGLKAAVLAIVLQAVLRVGKRALKNCKRALKNWMTVALAAAAFVAIVVFDVPFRLIVLTAGVIGYVGGRAGRSSGPVAVTAAAARSSTAPSCSRTTSCRGSMWPCGTRCGCSAFGRPSGCRRSR